MESPASSSACSQAVSSRGALPPAAPTPNESAAAATATSRATPVIAVIVDATQLSHCDALVTSAGGAAAPRRSPTPRPRSAPRPADQCARPKGARPEQKSESDAGEAGAAKRGEGRVG